jgi:catechol 2,3-dioxygenase-like lactoylglutathione lyase family enzyme
MTRRPFTKATPTPDWPPSLVPSHSPYPQRAAPAEGSNGAFIAKEIIANWYRHFAFEAGSLENLHALKASLEAHGVAVRGVEDHEGWRRSIYFTDPNGLQLEYCCLSRKLTEDDARPQVRFRVSREGKKLQA